MLCAPQLDRLDARSLAGGQLGSWRHRYGLHLVSQYRIHWPRRGKWCLTRGNGRKWSMTRARVATAAPPEREQSFGGGGGDLLGLICPELGVAPLVDPGTDCEDELSIPADPRADVIHEMDSELEQVFVDVVSLPTMVTPVCDSVSAQLLQDTQGCLFRMTSYDVEAGKPNFAPEYGVQLHDPRLLEYVGAPESPQLTSRSPEYWVHHMGREKALSVALPLQHYDGLILSNVQVLQQLVIALNRTSSDVLQPFPAKCKNSTGDAILQSTPCGTLHDGDGSVAPTSRHGDTRTPAVSRVQCLHVLPGLLPRGAYVSREAKLNYMTVTVTEQCFYIPCSLRCFCVTWGLVR